MSWLLEKIVINRIKDRYRLRNKILTFASLTEELGELETCLVEYDVAEADYVFGLDDFDVVFKREYLWPHEDYMVPNPLVLRRVRLGSASQSNPHSL